MFTILVGGVKILNNNNMCVFHLHYYDLSTPKINDLRRREFDNEIKIVSSENGGLSYQLQDKIVPCIPVSNVYGAQIIIAVSYTHLTLPTICSV